MKRGVIVEKNGLVLTAPSHRRATTTQPAWQEHPTRSPTRLNAPRSPSRSPSQPPTPVLPIHESPTQRAPWRDACEARLANWCSTYCGRTDLLARVVATTGQHSELSCVPEAGAEGVEATHISMEGAEVGGGTRRLRTDARTSGSGEGRSLWCPRRRPPHEHTALRTEWHECSSAAAKSPAGVPSVPSPRIDLQEGSCVTSEALRSIAPKLVSASTRSGLLSSSLISTARVVAAALVRDAASYLERNVLAILDLGRSFAAFRLVYVENDSADGTRDILRRMMARYPGIVSGEMLDNEALSLPNATSYELCPPRQSRRNCKERISLLATLRQRALERVRYTRAPHADCICNCI